MLTTAYNILEVKRSCNVTSSVRNVYNAVNSRQIVQLEEVAHIRSIFDPHMFTYSSCMISVFVLL